jgi:Xaa-Pro aminopeptidase
MLACIIYINAIIARMEKRIKQVRDILKTENVDALLMSSSYNIRYLTGFDGFGTHEREGYALLTSSNLYILADPRLSEAAKKNAIASIIVEFGAGKKLLPQIQEIIDREKIRTVGFEENLTYSEFRRFKKLKAKLKMTEEIIEFVRQAKDKIELTSIKKSCTLTDKTYSNILKNIGMNMTEIEIAWIIEKYIKEHGGKLAFPSIVAFGKNSAVPHHKSASNKLKENSIILLDFGAKVDGYCADMTRTIFFGKADPKFKKMYDAVLKGQELSLDLSGSSLTPDVIDKTARNHIISQGYPSISHSVGHGVGLEVHELPHISPGFNEELESNTVFTIEPGIYINGYGGVRIEDTVYYDGDRVVPLTKSPKSLFELTT